ncbi:hypothetical protein ACEZCY_13850 [Streptacidiphilus sp. N1-12]|uniref:Uncharacterized protein n=2 Tax=Streptacidiphilus alkalitolerans TaxID=3342712 RepID=A0ABV6V9E3_9ACTN
MYADLARRTGVRTRTVALIAAGGSATPRSRVRKRMRRAVERAVERLPRVSVRVRSEHR